VYFSWLDEFFVKVKIASVTSKIIPGKLKDETERGYNLLQLFENK